jgi:hypothetical protein
VDAGQAGKGEPHDAFDRLFLQWEEANDPALRGSDDVKELLDPRSLASEQCARPFRRERSAAHGADPGRCPLLVAACASVSCSNLPLSSPAISHTYSVIVIDIEELAHHRARLPSVSLGRAAIG